MVNEMCSPLNLYFYILGFFTEHFSLDSVSAAKLFVPNQNRKGKPENLSKR